MEKKLPKVFVNQIDKSFTNNEKVFYSNEKNIPSKSETTIYQKLNLIFHSFKNGEKLSVWIETKDWKAKKKIIGKTRNYLITIENEKIPIKEILDIKKES